MLNQFLILISYMLVFAIALMIVAFGGMFTERSGVINIGLEGTMVIGALASVLTLKGLQGVNCPAWLCAIIAILVAIGVGMIFSLLLAFVCINLKADQTLVGTALNLIAGALAILICKRMSGGVSTEVNFDGSAFNIKLGTTSGFLSPFLFIGIAVLFITVYVLYRTRFGLRLRSCGENPAAADSVGINVKRYRYAGVLISGALAGLGAMAYILPGGQTSWNATTGVAGFGFLALAVMIFGQWKPVRIFVVSIIFSFFMALSYVYFGFFESAFGIQLTADKGITSDLFKMLPYIASLVLLAFTSKNSRAPKAEGIPYDKGGR